MVKVGITLADFSFCKKPRDTQKKLRNAVTAVERSGFDSFLLADHLMQYPRVGPIGDPVLESWTTLGLLSSVTSKLRLGTLVSNNALRHPGHLAKIGATLDVLSSGRLIFGIGSGSFRPEHSAFGIPRYPTAERAQRLAETVQIVSRLWTEETVSFAGRYYKLKNAVCNPKPLQKPHPPIVIGGNSDAVLKIAVNHGDGCNLTGDVDFVNERLRFARSACRAAGRRLESMILTSRINVIVGRDEQDAKSMLRRCRPKTISPQSFKYNTLVGSPEQVIEGLTAFAKAGIQYIWMALPDYKVGDSLEILGSRVLPNLS